MQFWISFWSVSLAVALILFVGLVSVVSCGGLKDVLALFRSIDAQHAEAGGKNPWQDAPAGPDSGNDGVSEDR